MPHKTPVLQYVVLAFLLVIAFGFGFWFGTKQQKVTSAVAQKTQTIEQKTMFALPVPGVEWIKAGADNICPADHPVKAKLDGTTGFYYLPDNKSYDRVKPAFCFVTEEYAKDTAGFIKK